MELTGEDRVGPVLLVTKGLDIGGLERIVVDLAIGLRRRGVEVEVAVVNDSRDGFRSLLIDAGIPVHGLAGTDSFNWRASRQLWRLASDRRFRVVHAHGPLSAFLVRLARLHAPLVTTSHTPLTAVRPATRRAWVGTAWRDAATIAVSSNVAESMPRRLAERAIVIPHGIDPAAVCAAKLNTAARGDRHDVIAIVVASHRDAKNYPNLLRAVRYARSLGAPLHLLAVGEGHDLAKNRRLAEELGLGNAVRFVPPQLDGLALIAASDLLVVASDYEGQPLVVAEALALGKPVVATAVGRVPELISSVLGRVVPPGDPRALGAALAEVASDDGLRARMSESALRRGVGRTLHDVIDAHMSVYGRVKSARTFG